MVRLLPGDIIDVLSGGDRRANADVRERAREQLGLTGSYPEQYWRWISGILQGDFGFSLRNTQPVSEILLDALPITLELVLLALLIAVVFGLPLGVLSAVKRDSAARLRRPGRRPDRHQHPQLLARDAAAPLHVARLRLGAAAHLHPALRRPDREPEPVHPPGDLDLGLHDGDRDAHGARDDARGARAGLRPHRAGEGRQPEGRDLEARAPERPDPRRHDRRLRDRGS